jgi:hypothetical protein
LPERVHDDLLRATRRDPNVNSTPAIDTAVVLW